MLIRYRGAPFAAFDFGQVQPTTEDLWDAWAFAAVDAQLALNAWMTAPTDDKGDAFSGYRAALDREEQAATLLAARSAD